MLSNIIQGIIQGLTEFLPVSSSGHLTLFQHFTGSHDLEANIFTDIALHFGTLLAVIFYFRADLLPFFTVSGLKDSKVRRLGILIITASVPTAIIGLFFEKKFEAVFSSPSLVAIALFVTGLLLLISEKFKTRHNSEKAKNVTELTYAKAAIVGIAQGLAVTPGISRSGSTIAAGLLFNLKGEDAARFSFLLMIPAVGGATLLHVLKVFKTGIPSSVDLPALMLGMIAAAITGFLSLRFLSYIIKKQKLSYFAYYLFAVSLTALFFINFAG